MEEVLERENLRKALRQVRRNKGAPGIDGMTGKGSFGYWPQPNLPSSGEQ
jgi:hypothetical protein